MSSTKQPLTKHHCMVVHAYYPLGEVRVQREAKALIDAGFEVDVICLRRPGEAPQAEEYKVQIYRLPVKRHKQYGVLVQLFEYLTFFFLAAWQLSKLHWRRRYTTVQVHNLPDFLVFSALIPKLLGARVILDLHDLMPEFYATRFGSDLNALPVKLVIGQEKLSCRFADHVITVSEHWRQSLIKRGVPANKASVLMNLADPRIFNGAQWIHRHSTPDSQFQLIYHGTITYRYGLDLLLEAVNLLQTDIPCIKLNLIGAGEYVETLQQMIQDLNLNEHVHLSGMIPAEQLPPLITLADLAVVPYRSGVFTDELLPTKLMEYAALGVPAIASRTAAIAAYFDETMVQFFTPGKADELAQSILALYRDRARLAELGTNIQKFNQRYNWPSQAAEYIRLVSNLSAMRNGSSLN